jgi:hypothetical protein
VATVRKGTKSSAQDNFIGPNDVTGVTSTNVGSGRAFNDGRIDVSWTNPSTGNTPTGYKVYDGATLKATITHPTSTAQITGLSSNTSYTFTVKAYDAYAETAGVSASAVTATTVPATPSAPSVSSPSAGNDSVSWSAPANGGAAITGYTWESNDSKSGTTSDTSVTVSQEQGTTQAYRVKATNANGDSAFSNYSADVTTTFSFAPFGAFGFTPFGAFGFTPFGAFGFTPFGFAPPNFR